MSFYQSYLRRFFPPTEFKRRLYDKLPILRAEIDAFKLEAGADWDKKPWLKIADDLFIKLEESVNKYEIQQGWKIYKNIGRLLIHGLAKGHDQSHLSRAKSIFYEALGKMEVDSWRRKSILDLLGKVDKATPEQWVFNEAATVENIIKANEILDEHQDNFYDKLLTVNGQIRLLTWTAFWSIALFIFIAPKVGDFPRHADLSLDAVSEMTEFLRKERNRDSLDKDAIEKRLENVERGDDDATQTEKSEGDKKALSKEDSLLKAKDGKPGSTASEGKKKRMHKDKESIPIHEDPRRLAVLVILMGIIGAIVSGFLRVIQTGAENTMPNQLFGTTILISRLVLATVAALAVYIFLGTGLLLLFSSKISFELLLAFCFVAGFSEKLVQKGVETLTKEEMYKGQKPK